MKLAKSMGYLSVLYILYELLAYTFCLQIGYLNLKNDLQFRYLKTGVYLFFSFPLSSSKFSFLKPLKNSV